MVITMCGVFHFEQGLHDVFDHGLWWTLEDFEFLGRKKDATDPKQNMCYAAIQWETKENSFNKHEQAVEIRFISYPEKWTILRNYLDSIVEN